MYFNTSGNRFGKKFWSQIWETVLGESIVLGLVYGWRLRCAGLLVFKKKIKRLGYWIWEETKK